MAPAAERDKGTVLEGPIVHSALYVKRLVMTTSMTPLRGAHASAWGTPTSLSVNPSTRVSGNTMEDEAIMIGQRKLIRPRAALLVLSAASCASTQQQASESPNPLTREVEQSQERSERAFDRAEKAPAAASDQARKASAAQLKVQQDEEKLAPVQNLARQEQGRAQELQKEAYQERKRADAEAACSQDAASRVLLRETQATSRGQQLAAGLVTEVRPDEGVVQPPEGDAMSFPRGAYQGSNDGPTAAGSAGERNPAVRPGQAAAEEPASS